jgi:hypothetical protein
MSLFGQLECHAAHIIREGVMRFVVDPHRILASSDFLAAGGLTVGGVHGDNDEGRRS